MRIGIVGLGLIGGSLGMALRQVDRSLEIVGVARSPEGAAAAERRGAVDQASSDPAILNGADLVVIATPIDQIAPCLERMAGVLSSTTLVTDVASVKRPVLEWAGRLIEPTRFLGGHPVAGKAESGLAAADPALFRDEPWIFTPSPEQDLQPFAPWVELVRAIGARPIFLSVDEHDRQMAFLSHLAFALSAAFAQTVDRNADSSLGGPGYRSMTRLAGGDPAMYESISRENREPLIEAIDRFRSVLDEYRDRVEKGDRLHELFSLRRGHVAV